MKILLAIAHYAAERTMQAADNLTRCIVGWHALATSGIQDFGGPCHATKQHQLDIIVVDDGVHTAHEYVPMGLSEFVYSEGEPLRLPLTCRAILDGRRYGYDLLCYSEHDNWPITGDFFDRVLMHAQAIPDSVLIPHRYEYIDAPPHKVYIDGPNGHGDYGALWAVTARQWEVWRGKSHFLEYSEELAGPLESGCAWSLLQTFHCVKPAHRAELESYHIGDRYARRSIGRGVVWS